MVRLRHPASCRVLVCPGATLCVGGRGEANRRDRRDRNVIAGIGNKLHSDHGGLGGTNMPGPSRQSGREWRAEAKKMSTDHDPLLNGSPGMKWPSPAMSGDEWR